MRVTYKNFRISDVQIYDQAYIDSTERTNSSRYNFEGDLYSIEGPNGSTTSQAPPPTQGERQRVRS